MQSCSTADILVSLDERVELTIGSNRDIPVLCVITPDGEVTGLKNNRLYLLIITLCLLLGNLGDKHSATYLRPCYNWLVPLPASWTFAKCLVALLGAYHLLNIPFIG